MNLRSLFSRRKEPPVAAVRGKPVRDPGRESLAAVRRQRATATAVGIPGTREPWGQTDVGAWQVDRKSASISIRRASYQSTILQSYLQRLRVQVIGDCGIQPDFTCISSEQDQKMVEMVWRDYCEQPDVTGRMSMIELQQALVESLATDGRVFAIRRRHSDYPYGMALMPIGRDWIADEQGWLRPKKVEGDGDGLLDVSQGVRYKKSGRIEGYVFYQSFSPAEISQLSLLTPIAPAYAGAGKTVTIPVADCYDLRRHRSVGDWDGAISWLLPAVSVLRRVAELDDTALTSLVAATQLMGFITRGIESPPAPGREPEEDFPAPANFEAGRVETLLRGEGFSAFNPTQPNLDQMAARKEYIRSLSTSLGFDYASLNSDAEAVNFSSIRHFESLNRDYCRDAVRVLVDTFMRRFTRDWLEWMSMMGHLEGVSMKSLMEARMCEFSSRRWQYIDPAKDAVFQTAMAKMMAKSPQMIAREMGINVDRVVEDWATLAKRIGVEGPEGLLQVFALLTGRGEVMSSASKGTEPGMGNDDPGAEEEGEGGEDDEDKE